MRKAQRAHWRRTFASQIAAVNWNWKTSEVIRVATELLDALEKVEAEEGVEI